MKNFTYSIKNGKIIKKSENLEGLINRVEWTKLKLIK